MDCECHSVAVFEIICLAFPAGQRSRNFKAGGLLFTPTIAGKLSGNWKTDGQKGLGGRTLNIYCGGNYGRRWSVSIAGRFSWGRSGK